jgi:hypothetical protein
MKTTNYSLNPSIFIANVTALEALELPHLPIVCFLFQKKEKKLK